MWAPHCDSVDVHVVEPFDKVLPMERGTDGYFSCDVRDVEAGARYFFRLNGEHERPDPASRFQPDGVHGPSEVVASERLDRLDRPLREYVIYEAHIGTLTPDGTFRSAIAVLDDLVELGITAFEMMPIAQFPGGRNWGYDGVYPYAPQNSYGGPSGLRELVRECHDRGLAVILDVVYNHLGPEGCYVDEFGPYFTDRHKTPWGRAINFDETAVRQFFAGNAIYWCEEFGIDALRLDAVFAIPDRSFLVELSRRVPGLLIAENGKFDAALTHGFGMDAQWYDEFHHALLAYMTGDRTGYYKNYGRVEQIVEALHHPDPGELVVFSANHDQIGNRAMGDRPAMRLSPEQLKTLARTVILSPEIPLIFMGEEYGETNPFQYFVSHSDPALVEAVRRGRKEEFPTDLDPPDPQDPETFERSKLDRQRNELWDFHKQLIEQRKSGTVVRDFTV